MENCIFCKIVKKELPAKIIYEDDDLIAFPTTEPVSRGHTLIIPKIHSENVLDIDKNTLTKLIEKTKQLTQKLVVENSATGVNLLHAAGKDAQQSVFHFHLHIVPRYPDDNLDLWFRNKL